VEDKEIYKSAVIICRISSYLIQESQMKSIAEKTANIKDAILKNVAAKYIYLFGSYAYGEPTEDSDIDIFVVVPENAGDLCFLYADIMGDIDQKDCETIDMRIIRESVFNSKKEGSRFVGTILSKGKLLYVAYQQAIKRSRS
jgi:predicted nucleotidyltransferase